MPLPPNTSNQHDNAMRAELERHSIWTLPPTLILFTLLVADRSLRTRFEADVAGILIEFGLSSPKHLIGLSERHCPVMPRIPVDATVADDIRHPLWSKWLEGAISQLDNFGTRATDSRTARLFQTRTGIGWSLARKTPSGRRLR